MTIDHALLARVLDVDLEQIYQRIRDKHHPLGVPLEYLFDEEVKRAGFDEGFLSFCWQYEYALQYTASRMTLLGLYEAHPVAAKWLLRQLSSDLSKELVTVCAEWERYAEIFFDNAVTTDDYFIARMLGFNEQTGWHLWPGLSPSGLLFQTKGFNRSSVLVAMIGYTFFNEETPDSDKVSPLALALQQFRCEMPVLLLDLEVVESACEDTHDIAVGIPSLGYYTWAKPTPKRCYDAIVAGIKLMQLRQQVALNEGDQQLDWAISPKTFSNAMHKYRRTISKSNKSAFR